MSRYLVGEVINQISMEYEVARQSVGDLLLSCLSCAATLKTGQARKYCQYGLTRRISRIHKALGRFYSFFQDETRGKEIDEEARYEQTSFLNLYLIDLSAALDNLARVLLAESGVTLRHSEISLMKEATRAHMPPALLAKLNQYSDWLRHLKNFRDPTAHRIAPYVPPYIQTPSGERIYDAYYVHDFDESPTVPLHPQVIVDAKTICEIVKTVIHSGHFRDNLK